MGISRTGMQLLLLAKESGVSFSKTLMIGRQNIRFDLNDLPVDSWKVMGSTPKELAAAIDTAGGYAEPFFHWLGAESVDSVDATNYEGASILHDMNEPISAIYEEKYTCTFDGGSLEHIFNFPTAIRNCMAVVSPGGHHLMLTPANNLLGHGFYQFSPELLYRVFSSANGFEVIKMLLVEFAPDGRWYEVIDPAKLRRRVSFFSVLPTYLFLIARRTERLPLMQVAPQQSDYATEWRQSDNPSSVVNPAHSQSFGRRLVRLVSGRKKAVVKAISSLLPGSVGDRVHDPHALKRIR